MTGNPSQPWHPDRKHYRCSRRENLTCIQAHIRNILALLPEYVDSYDAAAWSGCVSELGRRVRAAASSRIVNHATTSLATDSRSFKSVWPVSAAENPTLRRLSLTDQSLVAGCTLPWFITSAI